MFDPVIKVVKYGGRQIEEIVGGVRKLVSVGFVEDIVPDWFLRITVEAIPKALWGDTPEDQIEGALILIGWSVATSLFTGGTTLVFVAFWSIFVYIGIFRFSSLGEGIWDKATSLTTPSLPGVSKDGKYRRRRGR